MEKLTPELLDGLTKLLKVLIENYGSGGLIGIILGGITIAGAFMVFQDWRHNRVWNRLIDEKNKEIQRIAAESRRYRIMYLKLTGWTDKQIERFQIENEFDDHADARKALEKEPKQASKSSKVKRRRSRKRRTKT